MVTYTGINHLVLVTGNMDETIRFWRDLLGLRLVAGLGGSKYKHYFFEISEYDMIAFFEWPDAEKIPERDHGVPVKGPSAFDHVAFGVENDDDLWELKDRFEAADIWVSELIDHGFIHSIYTFDPNNIPIEFSAPVVGVDLRKHPKNKDKKPSDTALEGPDPRTGHWPEVTKPTPDKDRRVYPGEGKILDEDNENNTRKEKDSLGTIDVPESAYFGASTQRAVENFPISGLTFSSPFIYSLALIKKCSAMVNNELGLLDKKISGAIVASAQEVIDGKFDDQFVVDIFQTGSGTSTNMNMNEVIASRANQIITGEKGGKSPVHPNDHVNLGQSSNDVIPSTIHIAALALIKDRLIPSLVTLQESLLHKASEFENVKKIGRTHLQDAVPIFLGQEFGAYARQVVLGIKRIEAAEHGLAELALGGTAVGSGLNTHTDFAKKVIALISEHSKLDFKEAENHFQAQGAQDAAVETSGALKTIAVSLVKICNDIRWLASGPRCGLGEISIPSLQPGSSIMPGKINPVIPEAVIQVAAQVMGNDTTIMMGGQSGNLELNVMLPVIAYNLLQSIDLLSSGAKLLAEKCITGITANRQKCMDNIEKSLAMATYLVPHVGYDKAAFIAGKADETGKSIREVVLEEKILTENELTNALFSENIPVTDAKDKMKS